MVWSKKDKVTINIIVFFLLFASLALLLWQSIYYSRINTYTSEDVGISFKRLPGWKIDKKEFFGIADTCYSSGKKITKENSPAILVINRWVNYESMKNALDTHRTGAGEGMVDDLIIAKYRSIEEFISCQARLEGVKGKDIYEVLQNAPPTFVSGLTKKRAHYEADLTWAYGTYHAYFREIKGEILMAAVFLEKSETIEGVLRQIGFK